MAHYNGRSYSELTKGGFFLGLALFVVGAGSELVGHAVFGSLPQWENTLLFALTLLGFAIGFASPFVFGIVMPLLE
ncbi:MULTISPECIES: DUF7860 family protein [Natrinema]|uniref:Major facilitator superfamily (MFS) profile domain-containing protein n=3 Tax=Natrinema TaxID=88723 RepID=L9ZEQ4_NATA2|nr:MULTISPECIES: hypothetical protein [Natrinema]ELY76495.1 hypothetical protein C487_11739 [Natrinema pallidum DSM 3751]ELY84082.1 hypothetical protein C485_16585 [Natrinema altunense JCM 12890]QCW03123.1 hypothetical protein FGF80_07680 [Natrinema pallidum]